MKWVVFSLMSAFVGISALSAHANDVPVLLSNDGLPANDLVYGSGNSARILNPEEAWDLSQQGVDLSQLNPDDSSDIWRNAPTDADDALDDALPVKDGDTVTLQAMLLNRVATEKFRFNVQVAIPNQPPKTLTVLIGSGLHSILLKKELLRKLGYKVAPIKYLSRINVVLPNKDTMDNAFPLAVLNQTVRDSKRWIMDPQPAGLGPLTVALRDVAVMEATPQFYTLALGAPVQQIPNTGDFRPLGQRVLRALAPLYALANIPENVEQAAWNVGRNENGQTLLSIEEPGNFACTLDDVKWIARKAAKLTRQDFESVVRRAYFPDYVGKLVVENLIARRDSLTEKFATEAKQISFDPKVSLPPNLVNGKIANQKWQSLGYASNFTDADKQSPLHDIWWYFLSELESAATTSLVQKANERLPSKSPTDAIDAHQEKLFQQAMNSFATDGTTQAIKFGAWAAPIANGGIDLSRNIVIGSYMGTSGDNGSSNIVQLADNFGFHMNAGFYIGFDGVPTTPLPLNLQGQIMGSASIEVTHLKPIVSLKSAIQEPIKNEIVPWVFYKSAGIFSDIAALNPNGAQMTPEIQKKISDDLGQLTDFLGRGESLIITETLSANESVEAGVQAPVPYLTPTLGATPSASQVVLWRLHIHRQPQDPNNPASKADRIIVYRDHGAFDALQISVDGTIGSTVSLPVFQLTAKDLNGTAKTDLYNLNIEYNPQTNPDFFKNAAALVTAIRSQSVEAIQSMYKPLVITTKFKDTSGWMKFLTYVHRSLYMDGLTTITTPSGLTDSFLSLSDGRQQGGDTQSLYEDLINAVIGYFSPNSGFNFSTQSSQNPGQTYKGYSTTRDASIQAHLDNSISELYGKIQYRWEGWDIRSADVQKIVDSLSGKYGFKLFDDGYLQDTTHIQLYNLSLNLNLYQSAIQSILAMTPQAETALLKKYRDLYSCYAPPQGDDPMAPKPDLKGCNAISRFEAAFKVYHAKDVGWFGALTSYLGMSQDIQQYGQFFHDYWKGQSNNVAQAQSALELFSNLEQFVTFGDLVAATGGENETGEPANMYLQGKLSGFRVDSQNLSEPILSNTFGHINPDQTGGPVDDAQQILNVDGGEFNAEWTRDHL